MRAHMYSTYVRTHAYVLEFSIWRGFYSSLPAIKKRKCRDGHHNDLWSHSRYTLCEVLVRNEIWTWATPSGWGQIASWRERERNEIQKSSVLVVTWTMRKKEIFVFLWLHAAAPNPCTQRPLAFRTQCVGFAKATPYCFAVLTVKGLWPRPTIWSLISRAVSLSLCLHMQKLANFIHLFSPSFTLTLMKRAILCPNQLCMIKTPIFSQESGPRMFIYLCLPPTWHIRSSFPLSWPSCLLLTL